MCEVCQNSSIFSQSTRKKMAQRENKLFLETMVSIRTTLLDTETWELARFDDKCSSAGNSYDVNTCNFFHFHRFFSLAKPTKNSNKSKNCGYERRTNLGETLSSCKMNLQSVLATTYIQDVI